MKRRLGSFLLAAVMLCGLLAFVGCDSDKNIVEEPGPLGKYEPALTVGYAKAWTDDLTNLLSQLNQSPDNNVWTEYIRDELNIKMKLELGGPTDGAYFEKLTSAITANTVPDFAEVGYFGQGYVNIKRMYDSEMLADLTDIIDEYASEELKEVMEIVGEEAMEPCTYDGKIVALPQFYNIGGAAPAFWWIRSDWLKNLNMDVPKTFDDILDTIEAFTKNDPDMNDENDTYGLALDGGFMGQLSGIFAAYEAYPDVWIEKDGKLEYGSIQPEVKEALAVVRDLYAKGCLPANFTELSAGSSSTAQINGSQTGMIATVATAGFTFSTARVRNNEADFVCIPFMKADGTQAKAQTDIGVYSFYTVREDAAYPQALVKLINLYIKARQDASNDIELYEKLMDDSQGREIWKLAPFSTMVLPKGDDDYVQETAMKEALANRSDKQLKDSDKSIYANVVKYLDQGDNKLWGWNALFGENGTMWLLEKVRTEDYFIFDKFNSAPTDAMNEYSDALSELQWTVFAQIIAGEQELDYFDAFVAEWYSKGGTKMTQEANEWYEGLNRS